jgi:hypothetical protein
VAAGRGHALGSAARALTTALPPVPRPRYRRRPCHPSRTAVSDYNSSCACCEVGTSVLVIFLMWIMLAAVVGLIALWTAFFLGSFSGDHGASYAMG